MKFKEISIFFIVCYIVCVITKTIMNKFAFNSDFLLDSLFIALGSTIGWFLFQFIESKRRKK